MAGPGYQEGWAPQQGWAGYGAGPSWEQANPLAGGYAMPPQQLAQPYMMTLTPPDAQGGVIFLCDPRTEEECLQRGLFGLPASQTQVLRAVAPDVTLLFLFNVRAAPRASCEREKPAFPRLPPSFRRALRAARAQPPARRLAPDLPHVPH